MRLLQVNTTGNPHGAVGRIMHTLHNAAVHENMACMMAVGHTAHGKDCVALGGTFRRYACALEARLLGNDGCLTAGIDGKLLDVIDKFRPDIIHFHNLHGYYLNFSKIVDKLVQRRTPVVFTAHDTWLLSGRCAFPLQCQHFNTHLDNCNNCNYPGLYPQVWWNTPPVNKLEMISPLDAHIVVPSASMREIFLKSPLAHLPVSIIANGIDTEVFKPAEVETCEKDTIELLAVATNWSTRKNPEALLRLSEAIPPNWRLTIVGNGVKPAENIRVIEKKLNPEELAQLYRASSVLLSPSHSESFGMTVYEALACGIPAVVNAEAVPGVPASRGIYAASFQNTDELISCITKALHFRPSREISVPTVKEMTGLYLALYRQILSGH